MTLGFADIAIKNITGKLIWVFYMKYQDLCLWNVYYLLCID